MLFLQDTPLRHCYFVPRDTDCQRFCNKHQKTKRTLHLIYINLKINICGFQLILCDHIINIQSDEIQNIFFPSTRSVYLSIKTQLYLQLMWCLPLLLNFISKEMTYLLCTSQAILKGIFSDFNNIFL